MTRFLITVLTLLALITNAQQDALPIRLKKEAKDSIDYTIFGIDHGIYRLKTINQFKGQQVTADGQLFLYKYTGGNYNPLRPGPEPKLGDTLIFLSWYQQDRLISVRATEKTFGQLRLNKSANTLLITEFSYDRKTKRLVKSSCLFKILKWTFTEIILKDLSHPEYNRVFFFLRE